jgi:hypothetical protein
VALMLKNMAAQLRIAFFRLLAAVAAQTGDE